MTNPGDQTEEEASATWPLYDQVEEALRGYLRPEVAFEIDVREHGAGFAVDVALDTPPSEELLAFGTNLEARLSSQGYLVHVQFRESAHALPRPREYAHAKLEFDKIWQRLHPGSTGGARDLPTPRPPVRDFIYLDTDFLASLFAQSRRGLTTLVSLQEKGSKSGRSRSSAEREIVAFDVERFRGEMSVLHDYMFHVVELELHSSILTVTPAHTASPDGIDVLRASRMCKVDGKAQVHDYKRLAQLFHKFNAIMDAVAYSISKSTDMEAAIAAATSGNKGRRKEDWRERLAKQSNPKQLAKELGLSQDETLLKNLQMITELFYGDTYEVQILPSTIEQEGSMFRAILKKDYLRTPPERLRLLYGSPTQSRWTLVGTVTHITGPAMSGSSSPQASTGTSGQPIDASPGAMRDVYQTMLEAVNGMENFFRETSSRVEVILLPLAIYRDLREN
jgi:hypothetical protein